MSEWIPVGERLPEHEWYVLVSDKYGFIRIGYIKTDGWYIDGGNWFAPDRILAWMPLPQPYKPEVKP